MRKTRKIVRIKKVRKKSMMLPNRKPRKVKTSVIKKRVGRMVAPFREEAMAIRPVSVKAE